MVSREQMKFYERFFVGEEQMARVRENYRAVQTRFSHRVSQLKTSASCGKFISPKEYSPIALAKFDLAAFESDSSDYFSKANSEEFSMGAESVESVQQSTRLVGVAHSLRLPPANTTVFGRRQSLEEGVRCPTMQMPSVIRKMTHHDGSHE
jgi:hypothetical protein